MIAAATLSITLGVGANTTLFSVVNALWLRPLPVRAPDQIVVPYRPVVMSADGGVIDSHPLASVAALEDLGAFAGVTFEVDFRGRHDLWRPDVKLLSGQALETRAVAHDYFDVLGVPVRGRSFQREEDRFGAPPVTIISSSLWRRQFDGAVDVFGRVIQTTRGPLTVVGVAEAGFTGARLGDRIDLWIPAGSLGGFADVAVEPAAHQMMPVTLYCRLNSVVDASILEAKVRSVLDRRTTLRSLSSVSFPLRAEGDVTRLQAVLYRLWLIGLVVLCLCFGTLTSLFLARSESRRSEFAVRQALGASTGALLRVVSVEALVVSALGYVGSHVFSTALLTSMQSFILPLGVSVQDVAPRTDWNVLLFSAAVTVFAVAIAAAFALRQSRQIDIRSVLVAGARTTTPATAKRRRKGTAAQTTLTVALLAIGIALGLEVARTRSADAGFDTSGTVFLTLRPRLTPYLRLPSFDDDSATRVSDYRTLINKIRELPGTEAVAYGEPLVNVTEAPASPSPIVVGDHEVQIPVVVRTAGPDYADAHGLRRLAGRDLNAQDTQNAPDFASALKAAFGGSRAGQSNVTTAAPAAAIVNESLALALWPGQSPLGQVFAHGFLRTKYEVVGVVASGRSSDGTLAPAAFVAIRPLGTEMGMHELHLVMRVAGPKDRHISAARETALTLFADPTKIEFRTATEILAMGTASQSMTALLIACYAFVAAGLSLIGIFGTVTESVLESRQELAIRFALGAGDGRLRMMMVRRALRPVGVGVAIALPVFMIAWAALYGWGHTTGRVTELLAGFSLAAGVFVLAAAAAGLPGTALRRARLANG